MPNAQPLKIFLSCSEYAPMAKTGGLADVTAALSDYFHAMGQEIRVLVPYYGGLNLEGRTVEPVTELQDLHMLLGDRAIAYRIIRSVPAVPGPDVYLLDCPQLYGTEELYSGPDEHLRFILLSRASIEMCQRLQFEPDIFHCHDWHTALIPVYLKSIYAWDQMFANSRTVLTLHNIGYQGVFGTDVLAAAGLGESMDLLDPEDLDGGRINFLRSGVMHANLLTTVSPTYAREIMEPELGMGLERQLRSRSESVVGILNGVDYGEWDPENDPLIPYSYSARKPAGKERNKRAVLEEMGLEYRFDRPLVGMISRLTYQKGIELVKEVVPGLLSERDFSLLALGSGEEDHEQFFHWLQDEFPDRVGFYRGFNNGLAHRIEAGSDLFLMPSRYEPCGLNQMYSLRYGTVPVVRATGGLADSVRHFDPGSGQGTGVVFHDFDANGLSWALNTALDFYANKGAWRRLVANGMAQKYSWKEQGRIYLERFRKLARG